MEGTALSWPQVMATLKAYYVLTKPGIIRGNILTAIAGFLLAADGNFDAARFFGMAAGLALIIASGCVCNNYIDREIDSKMARTRGRALVNGTISEQNALLYAAVLGIGGTALLLLYTNLLAAALGVFGFVAYVVIYGVAKRRSEYGTIIGSISGAIPPVVGYAAVTGHLDLAAILLFVILVLWQMPHFYAIAMYRMADYKAAGIPVLPLQRGLQATKKQIVWYIGAYTLAVSGLTIIGSTGYAYLAVSVIVGALWLRLGLQGFSIPAATNKAQAADAADQRWARKMFGFSLIVISLLCVSLSLNSFLP